MSLALDLPDFRYHPDPIASGSIEQSDAVCECCDQVRGFIYSASIYGRSRVERLCPWCIASGQAQERFDVEFTDMDSLSGLPAGVCEEVTRRTPGFSSWQQERWLTHHGDACAFLGPAGRKEIEAFGSEELVASLRRDADFLSDEEFAGYFAGMDREGQPTAYVFRCLHCDVLLGYSDFT